MGHPAAGIAKLVDKLHKVGAGLKQGQIVLAGSFTRPVEMAAGYVIHADEGPLGPPASPSHRAPRRRCRRAAARALAEGRQKVGLALAA
jgi:hypothetical protein